MWAQCQSDWRRTQGELIESQSDGLKCSVINTTEKNFSINLIWKTKHALTSNPVITSSPLFENTSCVLPSNLKENSILVDKVSVAANCTKIEIQNIASVTFNTSAGSVRCQSDIVLPSPVANQENLIECSNNDKGACMKIGERLRKGLLQCYQDIDLFSGNRGTILNPNDPNDRRCITLQTNERNVANSINPQSCSSDTNPNKICEQKSTLLPRLEWVGDSLEPINGVW